MQMDLPLSFSLGMVDGLPAPPVTSGDSTTMFSTYGDSLLLPTLDMGKTSSSSNSSNVSLFDDPMLDVTHPSLATSTTPSSTSTSELPAPQDNEDYWTEVLNSMARPTKDLFPPTVTVNPWEQITPNMELVPACHSLQQQVCGSDLPAWPETIAAIFNSRLKYILDECSTAPTRTVLENTTPWSHPALWATQAGMPRTMQDAQACCALHIARNAANTDVISRNLDSRALDLMAAPLPYISATSSPLSGDTSTSLVTQTSPLLEQLAHTQSLLLHLLMRMDDTAALPDQIAKSLDVSITALIEAMRYDTSTALEPKGDTVLPLYPLAPARDAWRAWVVAESARRTALIAFVTRQVFALKRGQPMPCTDDSFRTFAFSCPASLWSAGDAVEFALAWKAAGEAKESGGRDKRKIVNIMELKDTMENGEPSDFDALGKMSLTAVFGIDEVKGWYASKGAVF